MRAPAEDAGLLTRRLLHVAGPRTWPGAHEKVLDRSAAAEVHQEVPQSPKPGNDLVAAPWPKTSLVGLQMMMMIMRGLEISSLGPKVPQAYWLSLLIATPYPRSLVWHRRLIRRRAVARLLLRSYCKQDLSRS